MCGSMLTAGLLGMLLTGLAGTIEAKPARLPVSHMAPVAIMQACTCRLDYKEIICYSEQQVTNAYNWLLDHGYTAEIEPIDTNEWRVSGHLQQIPAMSSGQTISEKSALNRPGAV
jgi:hypothetical protein